MDWELQSILTRLENPLQYCIAFVKLFQSHSFDIAEVLRRRNCSHQSNKQRHSFCHWLNQDCHLPEFAYTCNCLLIGIQSKKGLVKKILVEINFGIEKFNDFGYFMPKKLQNIYNNQKVIGFCNKTFVESTDRYNSWPLTGHTHFFFHKNRFLADLRGIFVKKIIFGQSEKCM